MPNSYEEAKKMAEVWELNSSQTKPLSLYKKLKNYMKTWKPVSWVTLILTSQLMINFANVSSILFFVGFISYWFLIIMCLNISYLEKK